MERNIIALFILVGSIMSVLLIYLYFIYKVNREHLKFILKLEELKKKHNGDGSN